MSEQPNINGEEKIGSPAWIRTTIHGSKGRCPTIRRPGKISGRFDLKFSPRCYNTPHGSQSRPVPGPDFKPGVRYVVSRVGSTPTGFRQLSHLFSLVWWSSSEIVRFFVRVT